MEKNKSAGTSKWVLPCENEGIIHEVTPPYSPELNGVAERKNITLKEMMNSLFVSVSTPDNLWG